MKLGIDLGTSNSSVAFLDTMTRELLNVKVSSGDEPYDSILRSCALLKKNEVKIGAIADREYKANPENSKFIYSFKSFLNETHLRKQIIVPIKPMIIGYNYHLQEPIWAEREGKKIIGSEFTKDELMAGVVKFFSDVLQKSQNEIITRGEECEGYLIGVPLNAKMYYRFRLLDALKSSSPFAESFSSLLQKTTFIPEPVAASFCFNDKLSNHDKKVLIFDYGGGTLDLALLEYEKIQGHILPTKLLGLNALDKAGNYINESLKTYLLEKSPKYKGKYEALDPVQRYFEDQHIENIKIKLSTKSNLQEKLVSTRSTIEVTRAEFNKMLSGLICEIDTCIEDCFANAGINDYNEIDKVIMSGGSSLVPVFQNHIRELFGRDKVVAQNPSSIKEVEVALTGVSRGLVKYNDFIEMSGLQPNMYQLWDHGPQRFQTVLKRNHKKGKIEYDPSFRGYDGASLCFFYNMIKEETLIALVNIPYKIGKTWEVKISQRDVFGVFPRIQVYNQNGSLLIDLNFDEISEEDARRMITECNWELKRGKKDSWHIPPVPIEQGNFVEKIENNKTYEVLHEEEKEAECVYKDECYGPGGQPKCNGHRCDNGLIIEFSTGIKKTATGAFLKATDDWDLAKFDFKLRDIKTGAISQWDSFKNHEIKVLNFERDDHGR